MPLERGYVSSQGGSFCRKIRPSSQGQWQYAPAHWRYPRSQSPQSVKQNITRCISQPAEMQPGTWNVHSKKWLAFNWTMNQILHIGKRLEITMSIRLKKTGSFGAPEVKERWFRCLFFLVRWRVHGFLTPCVKKGMYVNIPWKFRTMGGVVLPLTTNISEAFGILCTCKTVPYFHLKDLR